MYSIILRTFAFEYETDMEKKDLKIVFMGTPEFAVGTLSRLLDGGYNVVAVVTQPDKPVGRHGSVTQPSAVKQYALAHGLPVLQPVKMKDEAFLADLAAYQADIQVVVAYRMLPEAVWNMPRFGTFNVHASLLPQYRGAAPINWAIINGERQTGVTTFFLDHEIDTGKIILQKPFDIPCDADVEYVYNGLMTLGAQAAIETLEAVLTHDGQVPAVEQPKVEHLLAAPKIFKETCAIDWQQTAKRIYDFVRGLSPYPGSWTSLAAVDKLSLPESTPTHSVKIFRTQRTDVPCNEPCGTLRVERNRLWVATADAWLEITELQLTGKRRMTAKDFLNGFQNIESFKMK